MSEACPNCGFDPDGGSGRCPSCGFHGEAQAAALPADEQELSVAEVEALPEPAESPAEEEGESPEQESEEAA